MVKRRHVLVLAGALALAAGCGGGGDALSQEEYEQRLQDVRTALDEGTSGLDQQPESLDQLADDVGEIRDRAEQAADELDGLEPPEEVAEAHERLHDGLHAFADDLGELQQAVEDGELQDIAELGSRLGSSDAIQQIQSAMEELQSKGYDVGE